MSKGLGQKIAIKFTEVLSGDVTGLLPIPVNHGDYFRPTGVATGSSQYSSFAPSRAFDGSTSSYWQTRTTGDQWLQIELEEPTWVYGFRWYIGSSHRPNSFNFQGSNDGENWEGILSDNSPNATGWHEFHADSPKQYKYYRWTVTSRYSSHLYIYEMELLGVAGNEGALTITGEEYQYVNGLLIPKEYKAISVEKHPDYSDDKHLLVTLHPQGRFNNVEGDLTVDYDASKGNLQGRGGAVEGFSYDFTPVGLETKPNPHAAETITITPYADIAFTRVYYRQRYGSEKITATANATVVFTYVGIINP